MIRMSLRSTIVAVALAGLAAGPVSAQQQAAQPNAGNQAPVLFPECAGLEDEALTECLNDLMLRTAREGKSVDEVMER